MKFRIFRGVILLTFAVITIYLFDLQIGSGAEYRTRADRNRIRLIAEEAPRGVIYDRHGGILVRNAPSYAVAVVPADLPEDRSQRTFIYEQLSRLLNVPVHSRLSARAGGPGLQSLPWLAGEKGIEELVDDARFNPYSPVIVKAKVEREVANTVEEMRIDLPGVYILRQPVRHYLLKENMAHVLGYTGSIPPDQVKEYEALGYAISDPVGLSGVEHAFEGDLRGGKGRRLVEVEASGREIRTLAVEPAAPGKNLVLTLDAQLQNASIKALETGLARARARAGSVLAMNPNNGEILAMVSLPSYDNNLFANGISDDDFAALLNDPDLPLFNRAVSGEYPLGSVFKIVPAAAALAEGIIDGSTKILDSGIIWVPNKFYPDNPLLAQPFYGWARRGLGLMDVVSALAWSSDIFFYQVSGGFQDIDGLGLRRLVHYSQLFGFGQPTGISLAGEARGLVPTDRWKRLTYAQSWVTGDTYNMGIGQGFLLATPLQILNATAAAVNGGNLYKPQVARALIDSNGHILSKMEPEVVRTLPINPEHLAVVRQGMRTAVTDGTARGVDFAELAVAGKTGTAEYPGPRDRRGHLPTHAWFTAFAPYEQPEIVLVVFVENGGEGSATAVPIAAEILKAYFQLPKDSPLAPDRSGVARGPFQISESPQSGAIVPRRRADVPPSFNARVLAQELRSSQTSGIVGWVRDRSGRPLGGVTLAVERDGQPIARLLTAADGSFKFETVAGDLLAEWLIRLETSDAAHGLTLYLQPGTKISVLFYEE